LKWPSGFRKKEIMNVNKCLIQKTKKSQSAYLWNAAPALKPKKNKTEH